MFLRNSFQAVLVTGIIVLCVSTYTTLERAEHQRAPLDQLSKDAVTNLPTVKSMHAVGMIYSLSG